MRPIRIYPYKMFCESAKLLAAELKSRKADVIRVFPDKGYHPKSNHLLVNWGCSTIPQWKNPMGYAFSVINRWDQVPNAINKIRAFARFKATGVSCPEVTVDSEKAKEWLAKGYTVVGRKSLTGKAGQGIVLMDKGSQFEQCPLYSQYKRKKKEFRVHVFDGKVIDVQEKRLKKDFQGEKNARIRTHGNGWVFCRENIVLPADTGEESIKAVAALGLVFGGVDIIYNEADNKSYVLEVNSAPGIEGTTVSKYADAILEYAVGKANT